MKAVAPIRKALGIRTIFNLIGPLANPAPLTFQLVGVSEARLLRPMAEALKRLGVRHGMVVHGHDGLDEVTTTGPTTVMEVQGGRVVERDLHPQELGIPRATLGDLRGGEAAQNAAIAREVLAGKRSPIRDMIVVNAGCAIYVAEQVRTIEEGIARANEALQSGSAAQLLEAVKRVSHA